MQINLEPSPDPARASASVVMLRDGAAGLEVFLVKRHGLSDVLGGAYVFPGGKVDRSDADDEVLALLDRPPAELKAQLGEPQLAEADAAALFVAALRESFEECGVLFAAQASGDVARTAWQLMREGRSFDETAALLRLTLAAGELVPWSRWITPAVGGVVRKRFDTRFFLARVPHGQEPRHDERETTHSEWLAPREALRRYWAREIELAPPQIMSLAHLARHAGAASAIAEAASRPPPLVQPEPLLEDGVRAVCYPGDARHPVRTRALPGPTRLSHIDGRFEPDGGFEALLRD
jgi:8-oxo-dGTP pyrophosphatase MutT (NUDIX family)